MPSTYASRAIGSYEMQAKAFSQSASTREERRLDRRTPGSVLRKENEKQNFADVLNEVSAKQRT